MRLINPVFAVAVVGAAVALASALWDRHKPPGELRVRARRPLGTRDQAMYERLVQAFPGHVVLAKVALTTLVTTPRRDRARFHHRHVDFVVLDPAYEVLAAFGVDDASTASRLALGEPVRELLEEAGYRVHEFTEVPSVAQLRQLAGPAARPAAPAPPPAG